MKKLFLLAFLLTPGLAFAQYAPSPETMYALLIGLIIGTIITAIIKVKIWIKVILFIPITFFSMYTAFYTESAIFNIKADYRNKVLDEKISSNPLRIAICNNNVEEVKSILVKPLDDFTDKEVSTFFTNCSQNGINTEMAVVVMKFLQSQKYTYNSYGYCSVLHNFHAKFNVDVLKALVSANLPIECTDKNTIISTFGYLDSASPLDKETEQKVYDWLNFVLENKLFVDLEKTSMNTLVENGSARIILLSLKFGDFYKPNLMTYKAPIDIWTKRMFYYCEGCPQKENTWNLTKEDIEAVNKQIVLLNAEEINNKNMLHELKSFQYYPDSGAAFFSYLVKNGAKLNRANYNGRSFLAEHESLSPPFIAELKKLSKEQVNDLAYPMMVRDGVIISEPAIPLLNLARLNKNKELIDFLCSNNIKGC